MINQATPHLAAWSSLINMSAIIVMDSLGFALTIEWKASMQMSQYIERTKKALDSN